MCTAKRNHKNLDKHSLNRDAPEFINESDDGFYTCTNEHDESFSFTIKGRYLAHVKRVGTGIDDSALNGYQYWGILKEENQNISVYGIMDSIFPPALKMLYLEKDKMDDSRLSKPLLATFLTSPTSTSAELNDRIRQSVRLYAALSIQTTQSHLLGKVRTSP